MLYFTQITQPTLPLSQPKLYPNPKQDVTSNKLPECVFCDIQIWNEMPIDSRKFCDAECIGDYSKG